MNQTAQPEERIVEELRRAFDDSFATAAAVDTEEYLSLIGIRVAGEPLMLRAEQITGIARLRLVVPVPSRSTALMGITGMRGMVVPVFNLAVLIGLGAQTGKCDWAALAHRDSPVALGFETFEGQTEISRASLFEGTETAVRHVRQLVRVGPLVRGVVDMASVIEEIRAAAAPVRS